MEQDAQDDPSGVVRNVNAVVRLSAKAKPYWYEATEAFAAYDITQDGYLSSEEFRLAVASLNLPFSQEEVDELFRTADEDGDGQIDMEEFKKNVMTKFSDFMDV